jgi:microcystin-dependent protein
MLCMTVSPLALAQSKPASGADKPSSRANTEREQEERQQKRYEELKAAIVRIVPAGTVIAYAAPIDGGERKPPPGWLVCNGAEVSKALYPELCTALGSSYGPAADGNCRLPDYTGLFLRGLDAAGTRDQGERGSMFTGGPKGRVVGSVQEDATSLKGIKVESTKLPPGVRTEGNHTVHEDTDTSPGEVNLRETSVATHSHALSGGAEETRPKNAAVHYLISAY